jgi:GT2 family glycosyltransferase
MGWSGARNTGAQSLLESDADGCMWVDSDILMAPGVMARLIHTAVKNDFSILSGIYHQRDIPYSPVIYEYNPSGDDFKQLYMYPKDCVINPGGCGFGFVWTHRRVFEKIAKMSDFDSDRGGWFPDLRDVSGKGEDLAFCSKAQRAGFQIHVDTSIQVGHVGDGEVISIKDHLKYREEHDYKGERIGTRVGRWGASGVE